MNEEDKKKMKIPGDQSARMSTRFKEKENPLIRPEPPKSWVLTLVGIVAGWILVAALLQTDSLNSIPLAIIGLSVTSVWCCLYMARR